MKLLLWEKNGFTLFYRRLEKGAFELPVFNHDDRSMQITCDQLNFMLKGISLKEVKYRKTYQHRHATEYFINLKADESALTGEVLIIAGGVCVRRSIWGKAWLWLSFWK